MTIPTVPPAAADATDPAADGRTTTASALPSERFFLWIAGLGIARSDGWLGGIAAGIAARLRIDPLIVRGVLVIAALFGLPVIFLYAIAWALLPDADGRIHARDLLNRDFQPVQVGILVMAIIGLIPTAPLTGRLFGLGYESWSALAVLSWIFALLLVGGLLFLIVRAASRTPGAPSTVGTMASPDPAAPAASATLGDSGTAEGADALPSPPADPAAHAAAGPASLATLEPSEVAAARPTPPAPLPGGTQSPEELAAWRAQHAAWREQDQAWRRQQQDAERAARDQLRRERQAAAATFAAEASERRRIRRASNPRASFAFVASAMGLALAVGAAVGLTGGPAAGALGLLAAALVLAVSMIVAGVSRRRSGFLGFLTALVLAGGVTASSFAAFDDLTLGWASISNVEASHVRQPFGDLNVTLLPHDSGPRPIVIDKGTGQTWIDVQPGVELDLTATIEQGTISWMRIEADSGRILDSGTWPLVGRQDGTRTAVATASAENTSVVTRQPVTLTQTSGDVQVTIYETAEEE
ncbi:MAG: PspC domain-containing protein [Candidatus Microbacterium colombiense]|nr:MAG: PspC domain-containing protein [Microbacterium sp.]